MQTLASKTNKTNNNNIPISHAYVSYTCTIKVVFNRHSRDKGKLTG